ncbi:GNAT family N-acetyltransferase [Gorillibacterium sp. sgz5001074]|uniref:GNAT family N-acetyltransferase n=1 Tax=Gorillibacterium sp. sgz5001074 TaxID=3446695 RepID=UPI003F66EA6E
MAETAETSLQPQPLEVRLAKGAGELEAAFRLRYEVFVEEEKNLALRNASRLETDGYDAFCDHLIVKDLEADRVVGTYRLLPGDRAEANIGFYSETEFDLTGFRQHIRHTLELGRSCIAPDYRGGRAIQLLWEGIARYIAGSPYDFLVGCASVHFRNREDLLETVSLLRHKGIMTDRYGIQPLPTHRIEGLAEERTVADEKEAFRRLPPLMKGYQWLGAEIGGAPAYDPVFDTVDFFIVLQQEKMSRRYRRHFLNG